MPLKIKFPEWLKNPVLLAKIYSYVYLLLSFYQVLTFWYDVAGLLLNITWAYILIFIAFVIPPLVLGFVLLIAVHKRDLQKIWIWWLLEIVLVVLYVTLFLVGIHGLTWKVVLLNLILHGALRVLGLKLIYDYMIFISSSASTSQTGSAGGLNRIDISKSGMEMSSTNSTNTNTGNPFENVPLDDPWSADLEKL